MLLLESKKAITCTLQISFVFLLLVNGSVIDYYKYLLIINIDAYILSIRNDMNLLRGGIRSGLCEQQNRY